MITTHASITIAKDGTADVMLDGSSTPIAAAGLAAAKAVGLRHIKRAAQRNSSTITVTIHEPQHVSYLNIDPDGTITPQENPPMNSPQHAETPTADTPWTQPEETPAPQPAPTATATAQTPISAPSHPIEPAIPWDTTAAPTASPAPQLTSVTEPEPEPEDPDWVARAQQPATQGLRGTLNGVGLSLAPSAQELQKRREEYDQEIAATQAAEEAARRQAEDDSRRAARAREDEKRTREQRRAIQANFQGSRTILVANPKGGARKTTTTYLVGATLGTIRGGAVITWDANETQGTLGDRAAQDFHSRTVVDLLEEAADEFSSIEGSRQGTLDRFVRPQGDSHFDVLASDEDPTRQDIVDAEGFRRVHDILTRFYRLVLVDTGNNIRASHFRAAAEAADQLVIPVAASRDSAKPAHKMMEALIASGHEALVKNAVVLIHDLEARTQADETYFETVREIAADFEGRVSAVVPIPFDASLKDGDEIQYEALAEPTRRAYTEATAAITTALRRATLEN